MEGMHSHTASQRDAAASSTVSRTDGDSIAWRSRRRESVCMRDTCMPASVVCRCRGRTKKVTCAPARSSAAPYTWPTAPAPTTSTRFMILRCSRPSPPARWVPRGERGVKRLPAVREDTEARGAAFQHQTTTLPDRIPSPVRSRTHGRVRTTPTLPGPGRRATLRAGTPRCARARFPCPTGRMILGATNPPDFPIGESDYRTLRRAGQTYVDKTLWIADLLDNSGKVLLVPRPRRFGKTLNMTTLRAFLERSDDDTTDCFEDTALWQAKGGAYRAHFQRYPVIYLSFKDVKERDWTTCGRHLVRLLTSTTRDLDRRRHLDLQSSGDVGRARQLTDADSPIDVFTDMLADISAWCHRATGERPFILIDEYDAPLHAAWQHGYWEEAVSFFRGFLSGGLKDNPHLLKGVLTGILKVSKEGIFSGLNHLETSSIVNDRLVDRFGFTDAEVAALAGASGRRDELDAMRGWYNGYIFGAAHRTLLYNPWSILNYLKDPGIGPRPFWKNTSDNALIRDLMIRHAATVAPHVEQLLNGQTVRTLLEENVPVQHLHDQPLSVLGLLTFSGYLTVDSIAANDDGAFDCALRIPNREVRSIFTDTFHGCLQEASVSAATAGLTALSDAMLGGDTEAFEEQLEAIMVAMLSHHDLAGERVEAVYQAFLVGLLVHLQDTHRVVSNREAGFGRADVLVMPRTPGPGAVLELKRITRRETAERALERAAAQLQQRDYAAEVRAAGATTVHQYAVVFDGKCCWVEMVEEQGRRQPGTNSLI
ncbi:MAG: hypothetical protein EA398_04975 [Deltaproteobacteria bacterium]|nr:MAG: hypothetical protein EA398_04975 [Deltaproteobacteria bacterium]